MTEDTPGRWQDSIDTLTAEEQRAARLMESAIHVSPLSDARMELMWRRINAPRVRPRRPWFTPWQLVLAGALLAGGAAAGVAWQKARPAPAPEAAVDPATLPVAPAPRNVADPLVVPEEIDVDEVKAPKAAIPGEPDRKQLDDALGEESAMLAEAIRDLQIRRQPRAALARLAEYERRFPSGTLSLEAQVTRANALLVLDDRSAALDTLNRLPIASVGSAANWFVVRGELKSTSGDCGGAVADFGEALKRNPGSALQARALYGRATCHRRSGNLVAAKRDLAASLKHAPNGTFAPAAARALEDMKR